jgi:predicted nucleotide-binding protein (sugar kinase/HSP70/actin superfamily)
MKAKLINTLLLEHYNLNPQKLQNKFGFNFPEYDYLDNVFDHVRYIYEQEHSISEKSFNELDSAEKLIRNIFNKNILEIKRLCDKYENKKARYQLVGEIIYKTLVKKYES